MSNSTVLLALFKDVTPVAEMLDELRKWGVNDHDMTVLSGVPFPARVLGRPMVWERLPYISLSGAFVGFLVGIFLNAGTPLLYSIHVGGQPLIPIPPTAVLTYEFTMMGLIVSTFLGVLWESTFPSFGPKRYHPRITDGRIGILFRCPPGHLLDIKAELQRRGAEEITEPEEWTL